jgi:hypothetical protein
VSSGAAITTTVANGPGNPGDWLGIYAVGSPSDPSNLISWKWLSTDDARGSIPPSGVTAGTVHLVAPTTAGQYEVRFFPSNTYNVSASSAAITVTATAPPPPPPPPPPSPQPVITISPSNPEVPDTTPLGAVVATYAVTMSDGSPFTGTVQFGAPNFDGGGVFALSGSSIVVNPNGPGVGPNTSTITDHITLEAIA